MQDLTYGKFQGCSEKVVKTCKMVEKTGNKKSHSSEMVFLCKNGGKKERYWLKSPLFIPIIGK